MEEEVLQNVVVVKAAPVPATPTKTHTICFTSSPSTTSPVCRICHEGGTIEELASPCDCTGTMKFVHLLCLEKWLSTSGSDSCEICKFRFNTKRHSRSALEWLHTRMVFVGPFGLQINGTVLDAFLIDAVSLLILTPFFLILVYLCFVGSIVYMQKGLWEGPSLGMLSFLILITYLSWSYSIISDLDLVVHELIVVLYGHVHTAMIFSDAACGILSETAAATTIILVCSHLTLMFKCEHTNTTITATTASDKIPHASCEKIIAV